MECPCRSPAGGSPGGRGEAHGLGEGEPHDGAGVNLPLPFGGLQGVDPGAARQAGAQFTRRGHDGRKAGPALHGLGGPAQEVHPPGAFLGEGHRDFDRQGPEILGKVTRNIYISPGFLALRAASNHLAASARSFGRPR